jgi:hypothetical protein
VERPTSGRRHIRAGSITVAELIKNRPAPVRLPARDEAVTEEMVKDLLTEPPVAARPEAAAPNTHRRAPAKTRQLAKMAGLGLATGVLCASVAAASIINTHRQAATEAANRPAIEMTDEQALLPNLFTLGPAAGPERRITTELPVPNTGTAEATVDNPGPGPAAHPQPDPKKLATGTHAAPAEDPINAELVRRYYELLASHPTLALGLLDNVLRESDLSHFVSSWSQIRNIQVVDVQRRADGALLAVVEMMLPNGDTARVQQLLRVTGTMPQRITGAEIISAQRS